MNQKTTNRSINKLDKLVHNLDPLGLGGAPGEYSSVVFKLHNTFIANNGKISDNEIKLLFESVFGDLSNLITNEDCNLIKEMLSNDKLNQNI